MKFPVLAEVLDALETRYFVVCAGGAARDAWHGRPPKDFDLFVLQGLAETENYHQVAEITAANVRRLLPGATGVRVHETYNDSVSSIAYVVKFQYKGVDFDLIEYTTSMGTPAEQVEYFDSTLSMAWFVRGDADLGEYDTFYVCTSPEFNRVVNHLEKVRHLPHINNDVNNRLRYVQKKYPDYAYDFLPEQN